MTRDPGWSWLRILASVLLTASLLCPSIASASPIVALAPTTPTPTRAVSERPRTPTASNPSTPVVVPQPAPAQPEANAIPLGDPNAVGTLMRFAAQPANAANPEPDAYVDPKEVPTWRRYPALPQPSAPSPSPTGAAPAAVSTCGIDPTAAPELIELTRGLRNDPDLIYQYVHDTIEYTPIGGALKGPLGTLGGRKRHCV